MTIIGWGAQISVNLRVARALQKEGITAEIIDLKTILPWDKNKVLASCKKTGRVIIAHEAPKTSGFGAELASGIQEKCFTYLKAPIKRCTGWDTHFPSAFESFYLPNDERLLKDARQLIKY